MKSDMDARARIFPFALYIAFIVINDALAYLGMSVDALRWLYPIKIVAVLAMLLWFLRSYTELAWRPLGVGMLALGGCVGVVVLVLWVNLDAEWMQIGNSAGYDPRADGAIDWLLVVVRIAGAALVVPIIEELFWRSFLLRWIKSSAFLLVEPKRVGLVPLMASSCLFGIEHSLWLAGIVAGLAYGMLYMHTGRLWVSVFAHAVTNALLGAWIVFTGNWSYW